jgi:hypothetical protein
MGIGNGVSIGEVAINYGVSQIRRMTTNYTDEVMKQSLF